MVVEWGIVNGTYSSCNFPYDFQSLDKRCKSGNTDTDTNNDIFWYSHMIISHVSKVTIL